MVQLIYKSTANQRFTSEALEQLLVRARERNHSNDITGMLLYHYGEFLQVLEGPEDNVIRTFGSILLDPRHGAVRTVCREPIQMREFGEWSMGFVDINTRPESPHWKDALAKLTTSPDPRSRAKEYLHRFAA